MPWILMAFKLLSLCWVEQAIQLWQARSGGTLSVQGITTFPIPPQVSFHGLRLESGDPHSTLFTLQIPKGTIEFSISHFFERRSRISKIWLGAPHLQVVEGDQRQPQLQKKPPRYLWGIDRIEWKNGTFEYSRIHAGKTARIRLRSIEGQVDGLGPLYGRVHGKAHGQIEQSGEFWIYLLGKFFSPVQLAVDLKIRRQLLAELNSYFLPSDGLKLGGTLDQGSSHVDLEDANLHAWVQAAFHGLKFRFRSTSERGALLTLFANVSSSARLKKSNWLEESPNRVRSVRLIKNADETMLQALFRAMRDAALKVAQGGAE